MDDLIKDFLTETGENLGELDNCLLALEQSPDDASLISKVFRIIHTIKGTCGFLGLSRLEKVAHKGEDVLGLFRDKKLDVESSHISLILQCVDCIKHIIASIESTGKEPEGNDSELIRKLEDVYNNGGGSKDKISNEIEHPIDVPESQLPVQAIADHSAPEHVEPLHKAETPTAKPKTEDTPAAESSLASQSLRVNVEVLENLMTMVSELVLTRNQLLQIARQYKESEFLTPLQRLNHVVSDLQEGVMKNLCRAP